MTTKVTMATAEKLYTGGYISYPRTETNIFPKELDLTPLVQVTGVSKKTVHSWMPSTGVFQECTVFFETPVSFIKSRMTASPMN